MKKKVKYRFLLSAIMMLGILLTGCKIREDNSDCPRPFRVFVKAHDADGKDITNSGDVKQVVLFVFNDKNELIDVITMPESDFRNGVPVNIELDYPGYHSLNFMAWGNVDQNIDFPNHSSIDEWSDLYARLISDGGAALSPDAVFYGMLNAPVEYGGIEPGGDHTVIMTHRTAQVTITAINLRRAHGGIGYALANKNIDDSKYQFRLKESYNTVDNQGNFTGDKVYYLPDCSMNKEGTLNAPLFNAFPQVGKTFELEILYDGKVIYTFTEGTDGTPFVVELGRVLNIIIDFRAEIDIKVVITPWNVVYQYVEK